MPDPASEPKSGAQGTTRKPADSALPEETGSPTRSLLTRDNPENSELDGSKVYNYDDQPLSHLESVIFSEELNYIKNLENDYELITGNKVKITITRNHDNTFSLKIKYENDQKPLTSIPFAGNSDTTDDEVDMVVKELLANLELEIISRLQENSTRPDLSFTYVPGTNKVEVTNSGVTTIMTVHEAANTYLHEFSALTTEQHKKYTEYSFAEIKSSLDQLFSDGQLTEDELLKDPILVDLIENGLGWTDLFRFIWVFNDRGSDSPGEEIKSENFQILLDSIEGLIDPSKSFTIKPGDFPEIRIPDEIENVVIETDFGPASFNGPKANEYAEAWLTAYQDSPTFREMMHDLIAQSDNGKYSINLVSLSGTAGANAWEHRNGFFLNANTTRNLGELIEVMAHEALHDFNSAEAAVGLDAGHSHSTEHSTLIGAIFNELFAAGTDLGSFDFDADSNDYSSDVRILSNDNFMYTNIESSEVEYHPEIDIYTLREDYAEFQSLIESGDYPAALAILKQYDGLTISIETRDPGTFPQFVFYEKLYDIQTLFMKDLLVNGDGSDWFGEEPSVSKSNIIEFFNTIKKAMPNLEFKFKAAFDLLRLDIERDYPGLEFTPPHPLYTASQNGDYLT